MSPLTNQMRLVRQKNLSAPALFPFSSPLLPSPGQDPGSRSAAQVAEKEAKAAAFQRQAAIQNESQGKLQKKQYTSRGQAHKQAPGRRAPDGKDPSRKAAQHAADYRKLIPQSPIQQTM